MSSSLEQVSTPLSSTYQSHLASMTRKQYREENSDVWCIDHNDHSETQEGVKLRDGKPSGGKTLIASLYKQGLILLLSLRLFTFFCQILVNNPLMQLTNYLIHWMTLININLMTKWLTDILIYWLSILLIYRITDLPTYLRADFMTDSLIELLIY